MKKDSIEKEEKKNEQKIISIFFPFWDCKNSIKMNKIIFSTVN